MDINNFREQTYRTKSNSSGNQIPLESVTPDINGNANQEGVR